jgi:hypothetical protein
VRLRGEGGEAPEQRLVMPPISGHTREDGFDRERRDRQSSRLSNGQETDPSADGVNLVLREPAKRTQKRNKRERNF